MSGEHEPLVTVVLPTRNREHTIGISAASVLSQTYKKLELIIVDDASTDDTFSIVSKISDGRVSYVRLERNAGASAARNKGIDNASGEFVFFQDSDDIWLPEKIASQLTSHYELASRYGDVVGGFCRYVKLCGQSRVRIVPDRAGLGPAEGILQEAILHGNLVGTPTLMARTEALRALGGFDESLSTDEDWDLALRLTGEGRLAFTDEVLVCSLNSPDGVNKRPRARNILRIIERHAAAFSKSRRCHSSQLVIAAVDFLEGKEVQDAKWAARRSLRVWPSLKGLLLGLVPGYYMRLKRFKKRLVVDAPHDRLERD